MNEASRDGKEGSVKASGGSSHPLAVHSREEVQGHPSLEMPQLAEVDGNPVIL